MSFNTKIFLEAYIGIMTVLGAALIGIFLYRYADHSQMEAHAYVTIFLAFFAGVRVCLCCPAAMRLLPPSSPPRRTRGILQSRRPICLFHHTLPARTYAKHSA